MNRHNLWLRAMSGAIMLATVSTAFAADKPATKPDTTKPDTPTAPARPVKKTGTPAALTKAIDELQKEYAAFTAKPDSVVLRAEPDYLKTLPEDVTVDDVLTVIERNMNGAGPQVAYVKWQLLGVVPGKVEGAQAAKVFNAYRGSPAPLTPFTADPKVRQQLDKMLVGLKDGQESAINDQVGKRQAPITAANAPIIKYRDALYSRLPANADVLIARLQDAAVRTQSGTDAGRMITELESDVRTWLTTGATPQQANAVLGATREARKVKGPTVYTLAEWNSDAKPPGAKWKSSTPSLTGESVKKIEDAIKEYLANPQGGLKFK